MSEAKIVLTAEDKSKAAFDSATANLGKLKAAGDAVVGSLAAIGVTVSAGYFAELIHGAIDSADHLNDLTKSTDLSVETLSGLKLLAAQSGTDLDGLAKGVSRMTVEIGKAPDKFRALGITAKDGVGALKQFSDIFNGLTDINQRNALAQAVFNKSWAEMAPILAEGSAKIGETIEKGARLSGVTTEMAQAADAFNDKLAELTGTHGLMNRQVASLLPQLNALADDLLDLQGKADGADSSFHPLAETLRALIVTGGNVAFVFRMIGDDIGASAAQLEAFATGNWRGALDIGEASAKHAEEARESFDKWEKSAMGVATSLTAVADASDAMSRRLAAQSRAEAAAAAARAKAFLEGESAAKSAQSAYDALIKRITEQIALSDLELDKHRELTDSEKFEAKALADLEQMRSKISVAQAAAIKADIEEAKQKALKVQVQRSELDLAKQLAQQRQADKNTDYAQSAEGIKAITDGYAQRLAGVKSEIQAQKDDAAAVALVAQGNVTLAEAVQMVAIAHLQDEQATTAAGGVAYEALQKEIEARQQLLGILTDRAKFDQFNALWREVDQTAHDAFVAIFDGGNDAFKRLGQSLKRELIDLLYQMTVKKWIFQIFGNVTGGAAGGVAQGAGNSLVSSAGGSLVGTAGGAIGNYVGGGNIGAAYGWATGGMSSANAAGSIAANTAGTGIDGLLATNGAYGTAAAGAEGAIGAEAGGAALGAEAGAGAAAAEGALAAIPVVGWIALAAIAAYAIFGGKGGGPKTESGFGSSMPVGSDQGAGATAIANSIQSSYGTLASALGATSTQIKDLNVFYSQDPQGTAQTQLLVHGGSYDRAALYGGDFKNVGRSDQEFKDAVALSVDQLIVKNLQDSVSGKIGDYLKGFDIASSSLDTLNNALQVAQEVGLFDNALKGMGDSFQSLADMSIDATETFIKSMGGLQNAGAQLADYYSNYFSDDEKRRGTADSIASTLSKSGLTLTGDQVMGMSRADFRALVEATGPENPLYAALMSVEQAFAAITPAAQDAADSVNDTTSKFADAGKSLWEWVRNLGIDRAGTATPAQQLADSRSAYIEDRMLAQGGDYDAYSRLQSSAGAYIDAAKLNYSSGAGTQAIIDQVKAEIASLPAVRSYDSQQLEKLCDIAQSMLSLPQDVADNLAGSLEGYFSSYSSSVIDAYNAASLTMGSGLSGLGDITSGLGTTFSSGTASLADVIRSEMGQLRQQVGDLTIQVVALNGALQYGNTIGVENVKAVDFYGDATVNAINALPRSAATAPVGVIDSGGGP